MTKLEFFTRLLESMINDSDESIQDTINDRDNYARLYGKGYQFTKVYKDMTGAINREAGYGQGLAKALHLAERVQRTDISEVSLEELVEDE